MENDNSNTEIINYYNTTPSNFGINSGLKNSEFGHYIIHNKNTTTMTPIGFKKKHISPENMLLLKEQYNIDVILLLFVTLLYRLVGFNS